MNYKVIIVNMLGQTPSGMMAAIEAQMNVLSQDGYRFVHAFDTENRVYIFMGKSNEPKRGRPRKDDDEVTQID